MSETLIPAYYNTKINNHDWVIYMSGEKYLPAYPVKHVGPEPVKNIVKRYLVTDSSKHTEFDNDTINKYPLSILETFINENDETIEFNGSTYYLWKGYRQFYNETQPETSNCGTCTDEEYQLMLLTTTLEPNLPLTDDSPEFAYMINQQDGDKTDYLGYKYKFIAKIDEYNDGSRDCSMCNCMTRLYDYHSNSWLMDDKGVDELVDYFQYDGETMEWEGQTCYVWNRYIDGEKMHLHYGDDGAQQILTNTLWISLPLTFDSPEFVTWFNYSDLTYGKPDKFPFDRIEYQPDNVYSTIPIEMTYTEEIKEIPNVRTVLWCGEPHGREVDYYEYSGELMNWDGQQCYVWYLYGTYSESYYCQKLLTNTIDIELPFSEYSDDVVARLSDEDVIADYTKTRHIKHIEKTNDVVGDTIIEKHVIVK